MAGLYKLLELFRAQSCAAGPLYLRESRSSYLLNASVEELFEITDDRIRQLKNERVNASALREYLVYLKVTAMTTRVAPGVGGDGIENTGGQAQSRDVLHWEAWAGKKDALKLMAMNSKPAELEKALTGNAYQLSAEEVEKCILQLALIPSDTLERIVNLRVDAWVLDIASRKDFSHQVHRGLRRWRQEKRVKGESETPEVRKMIRDALVRDYKRTLFESEVREATLTRELFWKFDRECKEKGRKGDVKWGVWLTAEINRQLAQLHDFRKNKKRHHVAQKA